MWRTEEETTTRIKTDGRTGQSHEVGEDRSKSRSGRGQSKSGRPVACWNCGESGHIRKYCKKPAKEKDGVHVVAEDLANALLLTVDNSIDSWVLDSGASFHTTPDSDILENYVAGNHGKVYVMMASL